MPTSLGAHNARVEAARALLTKKGRRERGAYAFEGPTLLREALDCGIVPEEIFVTQAAVERGDAVARAQAAGSAVYAVDERTMKRLSDVETPTGIVAVTPIRQESPAQLLAEPGLAVLFAGLNDPGNAGTLMRSAEAFGIGRVIFGTPGVEPHHPKVVRSAMGSLFRMRVATAGPEELQAAAAGWSVAGLRAQGTPIGAVAWPERCLIAVGQERHGLGEFEALCTLFAAIPMAGRAESLNAAAAGSIAFYEATKRLNS